VPIPDPAKTAEQVASRFPALTEPHSPYIEALRALRTSLLLSRSGSAPKVILVTSSIAGEGKSMLSLNLGTVLAQQGKKVLLIEGDLRRPKLLRKLTVSPNDGLSSFLAGQSAEQNPVSVTIPTDEVPQLYLLPAGPVPPYPAELLGSDQMREGLRAWREYFDFIIIDGAPVLPVTDSVILSSMVDFTLLVARYKVTEQQSLDRSYRLLQSQVGHDKIGLVLNAVRQTAGAYYDYYGYRDSSYGENDHAQKTA
jgi:capsular exopolysaccharide synthesis family protein